MKGENLERISEIKGERIAVLEKRMIFSEREGGEARRKERERRRRDDGGLSARRRGEEKEMGSHFRRLLI